MASAKDEADRKRLWHEQTAELIASSEALNDEYAAKFKVTALVLRDELLTRVQRPDPTGRAHSKYDHPVNAITMGMVADDLELLARLLR